MRRRAGNLREVLPNGDPAMLDLRKLVDCCLNPTYARGRHKARVFRKFSRHRATRTRLSCERSCCPAAPRARRQFRFRATRRGDRWQTDVAVSRQGRRSMVRTIWIIRHGAPSSDAWSPARSCTTAHQNTHLSMSLKGIGFVVRDAIPRGILAFRRARSAMDRAAAVMRAARAKIQGPSGRDGRLRSLRLRRPAAASWARSSGACGLA